MRRYQLVLGGTAAGVAGVLAFHTQGTHLKIPSAAAVGGTSGTASPSTASSGAPAASAGAGTPASSGTPAPSGTASATRSATSADTPFQYGDMAVNVTVNGTRITKVTIATVNETDGRSVMIDRYAIPQLEQQVISAGSVNINGVSGATFTSQAFVDAVANALSKLGIK